MRLADFVAYDRLAPSRAVALMRKVAPRLRAKGLRRRRQGKRVAGTPRYSTRQEIAAICGWSYWTLQKAAAVVDAAKREPQLFSGLVGRMDESRNVEGAYRALLARSVALYLRKTYPPKGSDAF
jgi:hypothetical protein